MKKTYVPSYRRITDKNVDDVVTNVISIEEQYIYYDRANMCNKIKEIERATKAIREEKEWD